MTLSAAQLSAIFVAAGVSEYIFYPGAGFKLLDRNYETCSEDFILQSYEDCLDSLPPECVTTRQVGGGKTVRVMRHTMADGDDENEAGDCDDHTLIFWSHCVTGNWKKACRTGIRRGGLCMGPLEYVAIAKPSDVLPGGHDRNWFIDHDQKLKFFDPGMASIVTLEPVELQSISGGEAR
jgi:hypothetical protein